MNVPCPSRRPRKDRGAALLAALCFATVLAISLGSYLTLCYRSLALSTRSFRATQCASLAEAGIEDALWALNKSDWSAWSIDGTTATRTLTGFSCGNGVTASVALRVTNYNSSSGTQAITATATTSQPDGGTMTRTLKSDSARAPLFVNAVAATTGLVKFTAAGTSSVIDSYNSSLGLYSAQTPGHSAVLAAGSTSTASATVQLTNAQVKGFVATQSTGPSYSSTATLRGPTTVATTKIDPSRMSTSPYQPIFDIKSVSGTGTALSNPNSNSTTSIGTSGASTPAIYYSTGLNLTGSTRINVEGPVRLVIAGSLYIGLNGGSPLIDVKSTATLEIFVSGDIAIYGNGIANASRVPSRVAIYGTHTLTVPDMNTTAEFYGVIYTPNGDFKVLSNNPIYGAIVARNVTFTGSAPNVHYDVNLRNTVFAGVDTPYAVSNWHEVMPSD